MLSARYVPIAYVYTSLAAYFVAFAVSPGLVVWPAALGAIYPARPLFQIGIACAVLPHFALILLWFVRTRSTRLLGAGLLRFGLWLAQTCITRHDDLQTHGVLSMVHDASAGLWMIMLYWRTRDATSATSRLRVFAMYVANMLLSLHVLSKYLVSGNRSGNGFYTVLRGLSFMLELLYDYTSTDDFSGMTLKVDWVKSYSA